MLYVIKLNVTSEVGLVGSLFYDAFSVTRYGQLQQWLKTLHIWQWRYVKPPTQPGCREF
jgi:hypothetical protein